ncbi:MAG: hypothetical protein JSU59_11720 [Nitrospirota bacterium]|nr:MAG: hypothetical protein JSU59_11720 [Nitrospirota bacterium]
MKFDKRKPIHFLVEVGALLFLFTLGSMSLSCSMNPEYHPVEEFPEGMNTDELASASHTRLHTTQVSHRYQASFEEVWEAANQVALGFEIRYGKPILHINKKKGTIRFSDTNLFDRKKMPNNIETERLRGWKEQVEIKVRALKNNLIKVTVFRTVEGMVYFSPGRSATGIGVRTYRKYLEPEISNGELEDWFLTKIGDEVASSAQQAKSN